MGLIITWVLWPIEFKNADPADLRPSLQDDYVRMISTAYERDGDLGKAQKALASLGLSNPDQVFSSLISQEKQYSNDPLTQDALIHLSQALGYKLPYVAQRPAPNSGGTPSTVVIIATPTATVPIFKLVEHAQLSCSDEPETARLRFFVQDAQGHDLPNVAIEIRGEDVNEMVYTGLKPERGVGYADFEAAPGTFTVAILNAESDIVSDLVVGNPPTNCQTDRGATPRGWKLVFRQK